MNLKRGDTRTPIKAKLTNGTMPVDLTDCTVRFYMSDWKQKTLLIDREAEVVDATNGIVMFPFEYGETDVVGTHKGEFKVTFLDGRTETFPNEGFISIYIHSNLGGL